MLQSYSNTHYGNCRRTDVFRNLQKEIVSFFTITFLDSLNIPEVMYHL